MSTRVPFNVTTTSTIDGWRIEAYLGPVAIHRVAGTNFFSDWAADFSDFFGGRSEGYRNQLESLYSEAMRDALKQAEIRGGNFVLDYKVDFDEVTGKGKQMFMLTATGTAVRAIRTEGSAPVAEFGLGEVSGSEVNAIMRQNQILEAINSGRNVTRDDMEFLAERKLPDAIPYALRLIPDIPSSQPDDDIGKTQREIAYNYLLALPADLTSQKLYDVLMVNPQLGNPILSAILDLNLVSFDRVLSLFESQNHDVRRIALQTLRGGSSSYHPSDIQTIGQVIRLLPSCLMQRPLEAKKTTFGRDKIVWFCVCGRSVDEQKICETCGRGRSGIGHNDLSVSQAREFLVANSVLSKLCSPPNPGD